MPRHGPDAVTEGKRMKIKPEHYAHMRDAIAALPFTPAERRATILEKQPERYGNGGPGDLEKRVRWDMLWAAVGSSWICDNLYREGVNGPYTGVNDTHIDTALRAIMREVEA